MKKSTLIVILAIVLAAGFYAYKNIQTNKPAENSSNNGTESQSSNNPEEIDGSQDSDIESLIDAQRAVNYITYNIADISPEKAVLGGTWHATRAWVVEDTAKSQNIQVYAEYEDGHIMRKVLAEISVKGGETSYKVVALFEPGEADWKLIQGEDIAFGKALLLFEKNDAIGEWEKK